MVRKRFSWALAVLVVAALLAIPLTLWSSRPGTVPDSKGHSGDTSAVEVLENSFNGLQAVADDGPDVWVVSTDRVSEVNATTSGVVWVAKGHPYRFNVPSAIAYDGRHLWVANSGGNSVTEIDATTGALERVIGGTNFDLRSPDAVVYGGGNVWVANLYSNSVTEIDASTGGLVKVVEGAGFDLKYSDAIAYADGNVWFAGLSESVTEIRASSGALVRVTNPMKYGTEFVRSIAVCGPNVWVTMDARKSLDEFSGSTGKLIRVVNGAGHGFNLPLSIACSGAYLWVSGTWASRSMSFLTADRLSDSIVELDASNGALVKLERGTGHGGSLPQVLADAANRLWVTGGNDDVLTELNASSGALLKTVAGTVYGFNPPGAMVYDGKHLWVASDYADSGASGTGAITEINVSTGAPVRVITGIGSGIDNPTNLAFDGSHIWVANGVGDSVAELNDATGALVRIVKGTDTCSTATAQCGPDPQPMVANRQDLWVEELSSPNTISEIDVSTGAIIKNIAEAPNSDFQGMTYGGGHLWVVDLDNTENTDSVSEIDPTTDNVMRLLKPKLIRIDEDPHEEDSSGYYDAYGTDDIVYSNGYVWILCSDNKTGNDAVSEFNASTGAQVRVIDGNAYRLNAPDAIATDGQHVWVANGDCNGDSCGYGTSVTEIKASNGALVGVLKAVYYEFDGPSAIIYAGGTRRG
jgi:hypothetical protein